jgi:arginyl-tRNA synthetase
LEASKIIYVVDVAQSLHFKQFFNASKRFDWYKESTELIHLAFGRMRFPDKKMSTRKGNVLVLDDVLDESIKRSLEIIQEKNPSLENQENAAQKIGIGAIKYSILSQSPESNVEFKWDKILSFDGNSAPYLQYSYARTKSILRKINQEELQPPNKVKITQIERDLLHKLFQFRENCQQSAEKLKPNILANYLYELAQIFNKFYNNSPITKEEDPDLKAFRVYILEQFANTIKKGLQLLGGIEVLEEM